LNLEATKFLLLLHFILLNFLLIYWICEMCGFPLRIWKWKPNNKMKHLWGKWKFLVFYCLAWDTVWNFLGDFFRNFRWLEFFWKFPNRAKSHSTDSIWKNQQMFQCEIISIRLILCDFLIRFSNAWMKILIFNRFSSYFRSRSERSSMKQIPH
jgi:hypothetical protein